MRVAYTLEQCWHAVPGGTAVSAIEVASRLASDGDVEVIGVAGRHGAPAVAGFEPPIAVRALPIGRPFLYRAWVWAGWPRIESTVDCDLVHSTTIIPPATRKPLVVTVHDLAFLRHPEFFSSRANRMFRRSLDLVRDRASLVLCSSRATLDDCRDAGIEVERMRHVPLGVTPRAVTDVDRARVAATYELPERFVLFVGTLEPRKNLARLVEALASRPGMPPLVVAGMEGWGEWQPAHAHDVRFLGFVPAHNLPAIYEAATVFAFPSLWEGYGLPVVEAMSHGTAVVTSRATSTEEVAGGAAVLVDPLDVASIADGIDEALADTARLGDAGRVRAAECTWDATAAATLAAYREVLR
ncbi:MAG: glycosyltransferase family 4 protein [Ilumatobacteraceae bacterium]